MKADAYFTEEFQDLLLAAFIRHPQEFENIGGLIQPEYFWGVQSIQICSAAQKYYTEYSQFPSFEALTEYVYTQFARDEQEKADEAYAFLKRLEQIDTRDLPFVLKHTIKFARERALINCVRKAAQCMKSGEWPEEGFTPMFDEAMRIGENMLDFGFSAYDDADQVVAMATDKTYGVFPGFDELKSAWYNGWGPGWLIVPLAPPKSFKSGFCINIALNMVSNARAEPAVPVFYYACELSAELVLLRAYCALTNTPIQEVYENPNKFRASLPDTLNLKMGAPLVAKFFAAKTVTIADIRAHVKMAIAKFGHKPRVIIIDHAETIRAKKSGNNSNVSDWRQQADIYTDARALGSEFGCTVIMPDRCRKDAVEKRHPTATDFQGSFEKAGVVDAAIALCQTPEERAQNKMRYYVVINRHGPQYLQYEGTVDPATMRMTIDRKVEVTEEPDSPRDEVKDGAVKKSPRKMPQEGGKAKTKKAKEAKVTPDELEDRAY